MTHRHRILFLLNVLNVKYLYLQISIILLARLIFYIQCILVGTKSEQGIILNCAYNGYGNVLLCQLLVNFVATSTTLMHLIQMR